MVFRCKRPLALEVFKRAVRQELGEQDFSAVVKSVAKNCVCAGRLPGEADQRKTLPRQPKLQMHRSVFNRHWLRRAKSVTVLPFAIVGSVRPMATEAIHFLPCSKSIAVTGVDAKMLEHRRYWWQRKAIDLHVNGRGERQCRRRDSSRSRGLLRDSFE